MINVRPANERGLTRIDWLDSRHTFSFGDYHDPNQMGFRAPRVINDDRIGPSGGFGTHGHRDMEIVTYVLDGALEHRDSLGTGSVLRPGDVQRMTAGTGIRHSEFNPSPTEPLRLLQIWLLPAERNLPPGYEEHNFAPDEKRGQLKLVAASDGRDGALTIRQDVDLFATLLQPGETVTHQLRNGRFAWVQVAKGKIALNGHELGEGDGATVSDEQRLELRGLESADVLLFDLA